MRKAQKMLAVILAVLLLVSSGVSGITTAFAVEGKSTEAATEQTTEGHKVAQKVEPETALQTRSGSGPETESETKQTETETQTQKETEPETKKPAETESEEPETKKPANEKPSKPAANEPVSDVKAPRADGVSISSVDDADLVTLVPDRDFRRAIYDNFKNANWLAGDPENPPSATDESGNPRSRIEILKEILGTYTERFNASEYGIKDIEGIRYLKMVATGGLNYQADFTQNSITSIMPIVDPENPQDINFGAVVEVSPGRRRGLNAKFNFSHNPIRYFPDTIGKYTLGYVTWTDWTDNAADVVDSSKLHYYYLRGADEKFSGYMQAGYCHYDSEAGEYIEISDIEFDGRMLSSIARDASQEMEWEQTETGPNKNKNADLHYSNLTKSTYSYMTVWLPEFFRVWAATASSGAVNSATKSYSYTLYPSFTVFDKVELKDDASGTVRIKKIDELTKEPLEGAIFELYRADDDSRVQTEKPLVTDKDGYTAYTDVPKGIYYFKEVKAPDGYVLDKDTKHEVAVGYTAYVDGGLKTLNYTSADGTKINATAGDKETYITYQMEKMFGGKPVDFYLEDARGTRVDDTGDIVNVTINYASLKGKKGEKEQYKGLSAAELALKDHIDNNEIEGKVTAEITYNAQPAVTAEAKAGNAPAVDVQINKTWKGIGTDDTDLPEVNYTLYRTKKSGEEETVGECKVLVAGKEETVTVTDGKVTIPADSPKENYKCTYIDLPKYEKSSDGTYVTNDDGKLYAYKYFAKEEITQEEDGKYEKEGDVGEASDPVKQDDGTELITIPVTNYRKGKVKIQKSDSSQQREDLSGVRFKLEQEVTKDGVTSWDEVETGTTDAKGALEFKWLSWGKYRLTETQTWDGYILLQDPIVFEVKKEEIQDPNDFVYMIPNDYKFSVPRSGGIGSFWFLVSGSLLILIGGLWAYKRRFCIK